MTIPEADCYHDKVWPKFDREAAAGLSPEEIRRRWPRFSGTCPDCNTHVILYASWSHFHLGDW